MKNQHIRNSIGFLLIGCVSAFGIESCKVQTHAELPTRLAVMVIRATDTPKVRPHTLSPKEQQKLLEPFIKDNYNQYFLPQFDKLNTTIERQSAALDAISKSNKQFAEIITSMRQRSIRRNDSMTNAFNEERKARLGIERVYSDEQKKQIQRNAIQIRNLNDIANVLLAAGVILVLCIFGLIIAVRILWRRVNALVIKLSHA